MPLLPANALDRILTWSDFSRRTLPAPAPGVFATAAQTAVGLTLEYFRRNKALEESSKKWRALKFGHGR